VQGSAESDLGVAWRWLLAAIGRLPLGALGVAGALVGWLAGTLLRIRRRHVEGAMRAAGIAEATVPRTARAMYRSLGTSLVETLWFAARPEIAASTRVVFDEWSRVRLDEAHRGGRGFVLATAHAGNWELAAAALREHYPLAIVGKPLRVSSLERLCRAARASRRLRVVAPEGALGLARAALARGEGVALVIDQVPPSAHNAVEVDFLSGRVDVDRSPAALAAAMRAPLVLGVARRCEGPGKGAQRLEVLAVLSPPDTGRVPWITEASIALTRELERWILAHPASWLWMHRRWRRAPAAERANPAQRSQIRRSADPPRGHEVALRPRGSAPIATALQRIFRRLGGARCAGPACATGFRQEVGGGDGE
jgi:KDO2-lipid IV(A) lauroyltransferase